MILNTTLKIDIQKSNVIQWSFSLILEVDDFPIFHRQITLTLPKLLTPQSYRGVLCALLLDLLTIIVSALSV